MGVAWHVAWGVAYVAWHVAWHVAWRVAYVAWHVAWWGRRAAHDLNAQAKRRLVSMHTAGYLHAQAHDAHVAFMA